VTTAAAAAAAATAAASSGISCHLVTSTVNMVSLDYCSSLLDCSVKQNITLPIHQKIDQYLLRMLGIH